MQTQRQCQPACADCGRICNLVGGTAVGQVNHRCRDCHRNAKAAAAGSVSCEITHIDQFQLSMRPQTSLQQIGLNFHLRSELCTLWVELRSCCNITGHQRDSHSTVCEDCASGNCRFRDDLKIITKDFVRRCVCLAPTDRLELQRL